jgi:AcrR family transcriptional regulator
MPKGTTDRRVARTRALLQRAHISLLLEKGYDAITVEDICEAADVGRSTFYAHYANKDDLQRSGLEQLRQEIVAHRTDAATDGSASRRLEFSLPMFEHASGHIDHYRALVGSRGGPVALAAIRQILAEQLIAELAVNGTDNAVPTRFVVEFLLGAYMAVLTWWLDGGAKLPPQQMDAMYQRLALDGLVRLRGG